VVLAKLELPRELPTLRSRDAEEVKRAFKLTLAFAKKKGAAHRELAIRRLAELRDPVRTLTPLLSVGKAHERALAAHALRRLAPAKSLEPLLQRCALDGAREVRTEAALALAATGEEGVILPLVRALSSEYSSVRANSAEALGVAGFPAAVPALKAQLSNLTASAKASGQTAPPRSHIFVGKQTAYVQDFDVEVAQGAAVADPQVNTLHQGAVLDVRILAVTSSRTTTRTELGAIRTALAKLAPKAEAPAPSAD
jgi:HEAT repeat protein